MAYKYEKKHPDRNRYAVDGKTIRLTIRRRDGSEYIILFDGDDFAKVAPKQWQIKAQRNGRLEATTRVGGCGGAEFGLGRWLLEPPEGKIVHFVNGDPLDCRRENIRAVDRSELPHVGGHGASGEKFIRRVKERRPWAVMLPDATRIERRIGSYATIPEAVAARDAYLAAINQTTSARPPKGTEKETSIVELSTNVTPP